MALMKGSSRALQRQVDLTTAVCQERLLATHVRHVLGLVDLVSDRLPFDDALDIYVRVLQLTPEQARNVGSRALAEIGSRGAMPATPRPSAAEEAEEEEIPARKEAKKDGQPRSDALFSRLRRRVQGRVEDDLRQRINLAAARTESDLLETHVENALLFVRALESEMDAPEAIEEYLETMMLSEGVGDVIYHQALSRIADDVLPPLPDATKMAVEDAARDIDAGAGSTS